MLRVFAPLLIIGGALGGVSGNGFLVGDPGLWAMVAMALIIGGTMRSPLTGMFFMLEVTADFPALPALLCGSVAAMVVAVLLMRRPSSQKSLAGAGSTSRANLVPISLS
jgi:CIC family chloride channel protein